LPNPDEQAIDLVEAFKISDRPDLDASRSCGCVGHMDWGIGRFAAYNECWRQVRHGVNLPQLVRLGHGR
jgi:hypothetical protein